MKEGSYYRQYGLRLGNHVEEGSYYCQYGITIKLLMAVRTPLQSKAAADSGMQAEPDPRFCIVLDAVPSDEKREDEGRIAREDMKLRMPCNGEYLEFTTDVDMAKSLGYKWDTDGECAHWV